MKVRNTFLPFALPDFGEREINAVQDVLRSGWVTTGERTREFERSFADAVGAKHAVAVNSCTAAMHLSLEAVGLKPGDEVITTPYTFAATAEVIRYFDARPVFVDIDSTTFNIRADLLEQAITEKTRAIIPVHIAGLPADLDAISSVAARHDLVVIEDAAHAFPSTLNGRAIGGISDLTCFSFYATKTLSTGEGGMITTNRDDWAQRCRMMALHGISRDAWKRYTAEGSWYYEVTAPGYKYNLTDIASALGQVQLGKAALMHRRRVEIAGRFHKAFGDNPAFELPAGYGDEGHAWHLYMLRLNHEELSIDRAEFIEELKRCNIGASVHFIPLHMHPYYRETYGYEPHDYPVARAEFLREISLPIYSRMSDDDIEDIIKAVLGIARKHSKRFRLRTVSGSTNEKGI